MKPILIISIVATIVAGATNAEPVSPAQVSAAVAAATGTGLNPSPPFDTTLNSAVTVDSSSANAVGPSSPSATTAVAVKSTESQPPTTASQPETEDGGYHKVSLATEHRLNHNMV